jgi:guanylate kinase
MSEIYGPGFIIVLSAPSGSGKTTLARDLVASDSAIRFSTSYTTRPPREGEEDGEHYHFVSEATFEAMIEEDEFLEWADVFGHRYGTGASETQETLAQGIDLLFDIDVQGARRIRKKVPQAVLVFVLPPDYQTLRRRLIERGSENDDQLRRRLGLASQEAMQYHTYDYLVVNDRLEEAFADLEAIVRAERHRVNRSEARATTILNNFPHPETGGESSRES